MTYSLQHSLFHFLSFAFCFLLGPSLTGRKRVVTVTARRLNPGDSKSDSDRLELPGTPTYFSMPLFPESIDELLNG